MCGDSCNAPAAPESSDLVAMIHPSAQSQSRFKGRLRLSNRYAGATHSELDCQVLQMSQRLNVRIHKFGQPIGDGGASDSESDDDIPSNPVLHSFFLHSSDASALAMRLDLGVGGNGVVGRAVSILDDKRILVGQGIIGWSRQD